VKARKGRSQCETLGFAAPQRFEVLKNALSVEVRERQLRFFMSPALPNVDLTVDGGDTDWYSFLTGTFVTLGSLIGYALSETWPSRLLSGRSWSFKPLEKGG
jgi:hypothetical protein